MKNSAFFSRLFLFLSFCFNPVLCNVSLKKMRVQYLKTGNCYPSAEEFSDTITNVFLQFCVELNGVPYPYIQKCCVPSGSKVCFMGDIHGSEGSLLNNLDTLKKNKFLDDEFKIINKNSYMIFLGDYVDRGPSSVEVLNTLALLKLQNWDRVFLLRGNHELAGICPNGLKQDIQEKYKNEAAAIWDSVCILFQRLPLALYLGSGNDQENNNSPFWIQCCHGGFENINIKNFLDLDLKILSLKGVFKSLEINVENCGFLWSDFDDSHNDEESFGPNFRRGGVGYLINQATTKRFCKSLGIRAVFRGHDHSFYGLKIGGNEQGGQHWSYFEDGRLAAEVRKNSNGFAIDNISFPVFTFSTAAQAKEILMPYECFGILTTADDYKDWRLKPYEFEKEVSLENKQTSCSDIVFKAISLPFRICWGCCKACCCCCCHSGVNEDFIVLDGLDDDLLKTD